MAEFHKQFAEVEQQALMYRKHYEKSRKQRKELEQNVEQMNAVILELQQKKKNKELAQQIHVDKESIVETQGRPDTFQHELDQIRALSQSIIDMGTLYNEDIQGAEANGDFD